MEAIIFIGIQGVGKSTFYQRRFSGTHLRINLDTLNTRHREGLLLRSCIKGGKAFVVDNTNSTRLERSRYLVPAKAAGFRVTGYFFTCPIALALQRNALRPVSERVPDVAIRGTRNRLELPSFDEGFDELMAVRVGDDFGFRLEDWNSEI